LPDRDLPGVFDVKDAAARDPRKNPGPGFVIRRKPVWERAAEGKILSAGGFERG
jgi:hypothetical protein